MSPKDFVEKSQWILGPNFVKKPASSWLKEKSDKDTVDPDSPEVKSSKVNTCVVKESDVIVERLLSFSSWHKAKVAVALCLKYKRKLREKVMSKGKESSAGSPEQRCVSNTTASGELNVANLQEAEVEIIKRVQRQAFPSEIRSLQIIQANAKYGSWEGGKEKKAVLKKTSTLRTLDPFLDSGGVMRVGGPIRKATLLESLKNPVILPKSSHITALVISYVHERTHHNGRGIMFNELRASGSWIVDGNSMVRQFPNA